MKPGRTHKSNPCRVCEVKLCLETCVEKLLYIEKGKRGIYPIVSNLPHLKGNKYDR